MATSSSSKRILAEVKKLQDLATDNDPSATKFILDKSPGDDQPSEPKLILGRILPKSNIYNQAAFQIEIKLLPEYPFKAPELRFTTPIYHPNVDDKGKICVDVLNSSDSWKPTTPLTEVIKAVTDLIDNPKIDHALSPEIATEYTSNKAEFDRKALAMVKKSGLPRQ